jgi:hypothetical protein
MTLHPLPLLKTLTVLTLLAVGTARAAWLGNALPSAAAPALAASTDARYSVLDSILAVGDGGSTTDDATWALVHLARQGHVAAPAPLIDAGQTTPPLGAARADAANTVGRRAPVSAGLQTAQAATLEPRLQMARAAEPSDALPDPAWIALGGAMLALTGSRLQRRKHRDCRPAMLYVAR